MPRKPSAEISRELLDILFEEFDIWPKVRDGRLTSSPLVDKDVPSHHYPDALSRIVKHSLPNGKHVATSHRIEAVDGAILHEDAKDFHLQEVCLWRL